MRPRVNHGDGVGLVVGDIQQALGVYREGLGCGVYGDDVDGFVYFNNDGDGNAVRNADTLRGMVND